MIYITREMYSREFLNEFKACARHSGAPSSMNPTAKSVVKKTVQEVDDLDATEHSVMPSKKHPGHSSRSRGAAGVSGDPAVDPKTSPRYYKAQPSTNPTAKVKDVSSLDATEPPVVPTTKKHSGYSSHSYGATRVSDKTAPRCSKAQPSPKPKAKAKNVSSLHATELPVVATKRHPGYSSRSREATRVSDDPSVDRKTAPRYSKAQPSTAKVKNESTLDDATEPPVVPTKKHPGYSSHRRGTTRVSGNPPMDPKTAPMYSKAQPSTKLKAKAINVSSLHATEPPVVPTKKHPGYSSHRLGATRVSDDPPMVPKTARRHPRTQPSTNPIAKAERVFTKAAQSLEEHAIESSVMPSKNHPPFSHRRGVGMDYPVSMGNPNWHSWSQPSMNLATVKVENLSKKTAQCMLEEHLSHIDGLDIHLIDCLPPCTANYAYVNCPDHSSAQQVISELNNRLYHGNLLRAKLKNEYHASSSSWCSSSTRLTGAQPMRDVTTVKVLIYKPHPFAYGKPLDNLDKYFSKYGELKAPSVFRCGKPDYSYINFVSPASAEKCRVESPHILTDVQNVVVVAVPFRSTTGYGGSEVADLASFECTCDPLVASYVEREAKCHFQEGGEQVRVLAQQNKVSLYTSAGQGVADAAVDFVKKSISEHEAKVTSMEEFMDLCYLPALADKSVQEMLRAIQVPFELQIKAEEGGTLFAPSDLAKGLYHSLDDLSQAYSKCGDKKTVHADELKEYVFPAIESAPECRWYWEDEQAFKPYNPLLCEKLERAFSLKLTIQEPVGQFVYSIDTAKMVQVNTKTKRTRQIKREAVVRDNGIYKLSMQIRAHSDHIQDVKKEVIDQLDNVMTESTLPIPTGSSFVSHLLQIASDSFISASKAENSIVLRGVSDQVKQVEIDVMKEILAKQSEFTPSSSLPRYWEKQEKKCELKAVHRGCSEWNEVERHMKELRLSVSILRIERIQNLWQWEAYEHSHKRMSIKNHGVVNEKMLFHGCRGTPPEKIYNSEQGFDNRFASSGMWGEGTYFATKASYSSSYAHTTSEGHRQMFLAKVLTGITCRCPSSRTLKAPPKKSEMALSGVKNSFTNFHGSQNSQGTSMFEDERYDSVNGVTGGSEVYVIYDHHGKVYPAYLITFNSAKSLARKPVVKSSSSISPFGR